MIAPVTLISAKLIGFANSFFLLLPNLVAALVFMIAAWFFANLCSRGVSRLVASRGRGDLGTMLRSLTRGVIIGLALMFCAAIVFPSVQPADVFGALGIGSVAIGFAFKDILQNLLAGLLLLIQRPYRRGDQIAVKGFEGTVEHIESRATLIKTYDGRQVIIPNSDLYTSPVVVNTAFPIRRSELMIGVGYGDNPGKTIELFKKAMAGVEGVLADPPPEVLPWALNDSTVDMKARWWATSQRREQVYVKARVIEAIHKAAADAGVDLPFPTSVVLLHDQTEETDGDRLKQREGWPAGDNPPKPLRRSGRQRDPATAELE